MSDTAPTNQRDTQADKQAQDDQALMTAIDQLIAHSGCHDALGRPAAGYTKARDLAGLNSKRMLQAIERLLAARVIRKVPVTLTIGNNGKRQGEGLQRLSEGE
jgi:hypothetical protein